MTVRGPIRPGDLGLMLPHEHVLVDFIGADKVSPARYDADDAFKVILPHLVRLKKLGCRALAECTPSYLGKDPALLRRLAEASRLHLVTNTGYYGAAENKFLPRHAWVESAEQLAERWLQEWREGIARTGIRPGFIKIGVGGETLSELHRKLVRAAALTHRASGLVIASHTGPAALAAEQLAILREQGVLLSAFIWVHAQAERALSKCLALAEQGCWVSFDGFTPQDASRYTEVFLAFRDHGRLGQLLLSHDAGWYRPGEPGGGSFRGYDDLFRLLFPRLRKAGISQKEIRQVTVANPAAAFTVQIRAA